MAPHSSTLAWKIPWTEEPGLVGCSPWGREELDMTERLHFHFYFHALEKEMATHSSVLAWRILGTEEPGGLQSMGSHRVRHDWSDLAAVAARLNEVIRVESSLVWFVFKGKRCQGCKPRGETIITPGERPQNQPCDILILGFQSSELWGNECLLFKASERAILLC